MGYRHHTFFALAVSAALAGSSALGAEVGTTQALKFNTARALVVRGFAGELKLQTGRLPGVQIKMTGPKHRIAALRAELAGDTLMVRDESGGSSTTTVVSNGNSVVVSSSGGGQAVVIINGQEISAGPSADEPSLQATLSVASSIPVRIDGLKGTAEIGAGVNVVRVAIDSGEATLAQAHDTALEVTGSGSIMVDEASGDLQVTITGSGDTQIKEGDINNLLAAIEGSGEVTIAGQAERATLSIAGSGSIEVAKVIQKPTVSVTGSGEIVIGNW